MTTDQSITAGTPLIGIVIAMIRNEFAQTNLERHIIARIDSLEKVMGARLKHLEDR